MEDNKRLKGLPSAAEQMRIDKDEMHVAMSGKGIYDSNGSAAHYKNKLLEYMDSMERKYGTLVAYFISIGHEEKYRERLGNKENVTIEEDSIKMIWYKNLSEFYKNKLETNLNPLVIGEERTEIVNAPSKVRSLMKVELDSCSEDFFPELNEIVKMFDKK